MAAEPAGRPADGRLPAAIRPLIAVLRQLAEVVGALSDEQYQQKPVRVVSSNVGGHVRHCLDHVDALLSGIEEGTINYDRRRRGTDIETSRRAALAAIGRQERQLLDVPPGSEGRPLRLTALVSSALPPVELETSVGRELAFVLSHTIHHNALIDVQARTLGVPVPERFGYAPSTLAHLEKTSCVR
jgi:uncharacterized damage-inducible protein DinB